MARFQHGAVIGVDLLDMAVAFDEEQIVDFFDLDAAADEAKDDLFAVPLAYRVHDPVHGLVELFLCKRRPGRRRLRRRIRYLSIGR